MFAPNEVCSLFIDKQVIWGLRLLKNKGGFAVTAATRYEIAEGKEAEEEISEVLSELDATGLPLVLYKRFEGALSLDIALDVRRLPNQEMLLLLNEELPNYFPGDVDQYVWNWHVVYENAEENRCVVRVFLTEAEQWSLFVERLVKAKLKVDLFIHPFFALDPLLSESAISLPAAESDLVLMPLEGRRGREYRMTEMACSVAELLHIEIARFINEVPKAVLDVLILNAVVLLNGMKQPDGTLILPSKLRPSRGRFLQYVSILSMIACGCIGISLFARDFMDRDQYRKELQKQLRVVNQSIDQVKREIRGYSEISAILDNVKAKKWGNRHVLDFVYDFSSVLPEDMCCTSLRYTDPNIEVTIVTSLDADTTDLVSALENSSRIKVVRRNQSENRKNGTATLRLTLNYNYEGGN